VSAWALEGATALESICPCRSLVIGLWREAAEFVGTFLLVFAGSGAVVINEVSGGDVTSLGIGLSFGLAVMAAIYSIGHLSGAHINHGPGGSSFCLSWFIRLLRSPFHGLFDDGRFLTGLGVAFRLLGVTPGEEGYAREHTQNDGYSSQQNIFSLPLQRLTCCIPCWHDR
jgi:hypothetical protein